VKIKNMPAPANLTVPHFDTPGRIDLHDQDNNPLFTVTVNKQSGVLYFTFDRSKFESVAITPLSPKSFTVEMRPLPTYDE
jgi:hypothetical protein